MTAMDLFKFNACNLDHLTETYNIGFYLEYLSKWPHLCKVIEGPDGNIEGYRTSLFSLFFTVANRASPRKARGVSKLGPAVRGAVLAFN
jgi:hypothetical protein